MNTTPNPPAHLLRKIIDTGPLRCLASFMAKARTAATKRQDAAGLMELDVIGHFYAAELHVRHDAARDSAGIRDHVAGLIEAAQRIAADHIITPDEERELHAELTTLCHRSRRHASALTARKLPELP